MHRFAAVAAVGMSVASCAGTAKERMAKFEGLPLSAAIGNMSIAVGGCVKIISHLID
jgi:hypothetical protein